MEETIAETRAAAKRWTWRIPSYVLLPFYLMLIGVALRYAVYARTTNHWGVVDYLRALCVYDCNAYERLALNGYEGRPSGFDKGDANNWAFFPLYSILVWAINRITGLSMLIGGSILTSLLTVWAAILAWPLFDGKFRAYFLFCFFLFLGPASYYFSTLYTEALFILLTVAGFVLLRQRDYVTAGVTGALMSATRSTGLLFAAAILIAAFQNHLKDGGSIRQFFRELWKRTDLLLAVALVPVGICCFAVYLYVHSGDALAFVHIQRAWGRAFADPFHNLWLALTMQFNAHNYSTISTDLAFALASIAGLALSAVMAWKGKWDWAIFSLFGVLLPLSTNTYSMIRFVVGLAPVLIMASLLVGRWRWLFYLMLPALLILDVLLLPVWTSRSYYLM
ncbi:MAG: hypothetical protein HY834_04430 [Devosia nanyangense]|uniref:Glycosyltransferase RgtA/B/C/D-like domain-containing protein n=1 Tax=Devosia nanyangense TaxID=1228055 RepID=A0A933L015_9HYPH|nr:hypothetical protein [Devosia nanyangense]